MQHINTEIYPTTLDLDIIYEGNEYLSFGWVGNGNAKRTWIGDVDRTIYWKNWSQRYTVPAFGDAWDICEYRMRGGFYKSGGLLKSFTASLGTDNISNIPLYLFGVYDTAISAVTTDLKGTIRWCKIYRSEQLVRDFIPVRVGQTGYLYDKVSRKLFGNSGTGDFILGNDVNT
jgi:hypothetical protein